MPPSAPKKPDSSPIRSTPVKRENIDSTSPLPRPTRRAARLPGARNILTERPSRKRVMRIGASRKSSALREGGVSSTIVSKLALAVQLVQLGDRTELLGAGDAPRRSPGRCGWRAPPRGRARRGRCERSARRRCAWRRASSPTAPLSARSPAPPAARGRSGVARRRARRCPARSPGAARGRSSRPRPAALYARAPARARPRSWSCPPRPGRRRCRRSCRAAASRGVRRWRSGHRGIVTVQESDHRVRILTTTSF